MGNIKMEKKMKKKVILKCGGLKTEGVGKRGERKSVPSAVAVDCDSSWLSSLQKEKEERIYGSGTRVMRVTPLEILLGCTSWLYFWRLLGQRASAAQSTAHHSMEVGSVQSVGLIE